MPSERVCASRAGPHPQARLNDKPTRKGLVGRGGGSIFSHNGVPISQPLDPG